jgi:asparagine synthase (glutamine-hydrolysing)
MCGICGQFNFATDRPVDAAAVHAMARAIAHRGPDDEGYFIDGPIGLGFRRLSIIDLSGGHQPMSDAEGTIQVVFNGEIYNFQELRTELEASGHVFRTRSDTEVIVHGYKQWGDDVLPRLNGMFGLAIWDVRRRRLVLARDAAGIKLVYYRVDGQSVVFGSELRAVLAALPTRPSLDANAVNLFLRYRYTPSPLTLYEGVKKLAPGTKATFENGAWALSRWDRMPKSSGALPGSDDEAAEALLDVYRRALKRHLISDVPVGLLLSGGLDSGLLLALMSEHGRDWPTYTVGFGSAAFKDDELGEAAATAAVFGAANAQVTLDRSEFERSLRRIVTIVEEPVAASSIVPMYFVCERARADVKVALIGQGPDELFGGYKRHLGVRYGHLWRSMPAWIRAGAEAGLRRLPRNETLKRGLDSLDVAERVRRFQQVFSILPGPDVDALFRPGLLQPNAGDAILASWSELEAEMQDTDELGAFQLLEVRSSLPDELLMYADKLSMVHGLEARVPYLDREVVQFAHRLPASFKVRHGKGKWLHRDVCARFLPDAILRRRKKGFAVNVVDGWFQRSLDSRMSEYLLDDSSLMYRWLEPASVRGLFDDHRAGRHDRHKMLFSLVVFEEWLRANEAGGADTGAPMQRGTPLAIA